jgi:DNA-binding transcriptional MerR regulator
MEGNGQSESPATEKNLFRIGEVSRLTATKPFVLRFWETEFPMLQPVKSPKGHRLYRREDIETVFVIKRLLYDEGFTIAGARRHLRDQAADSNGANGENVALLAPGPHPPVGIDRRILLELRDSLRALLTVLESE